MPRTNYSVTLKDLLDAGLLQAGEELLCKPRKNDPPVASAPLGADGLIRHNGQTFGSPSSWAQAITGRAQNGWICVFAGERPLKEIRDAYGNSPAPKSPADRPPRRRRVRTASSPEEVRTGYSTPGADIDNPAPAPPLIPVDYATRAELENLREEVRVLRGKIDAAPPLRTDTADVGRDINGTLLDRIRNLKPAAAFEHLVGEFLKAKGFSNVVVTQQSRDGGIDGHCEMPFLNLRVAFEAKRYGHGNNVGSDPVQKFAGAMTGQFDKGLFITTSQFTVAATSWVEETPLAHTTLIDGDELVRQLIDLGLGIKTPSVVRYELDNDFFDRLERRR